MDKKGLEANQVKCDGCGSTMVFDPKTQNLLCESCGGKRVIEKSTDIKRHDIKEAKEEKHDEWKSFTKILKCTTCGAEIILNNLEYSGKCPYCSSAYVSETSKLPDFVPDSVIPFAFDENEAGNRFKAQLKRKFYVPNACKKSANAENIKGTYIPAFVFDASAKASYIAKLGQQTDDGMRTFTVSGNHSQDLKDVIVENSSKITQQNLKKILPFDMSKCYAFREEFILGYVVEHYENAFKTCYDMAIKEMQQTIKSQILSKYSYDTVYDFNMDCHFSNEKYRYNIVPIYQMNFKFKNKNYNVLMNGQSGKIGGKLPISPLKVIFTVVIVALIVALIVFLCNIS